jgi:hypothetical protein
VVDRARVQVAQLGWRQGGERDSSSPRRPRPITSRFAAGARPLIVSGIEHGRAEPAQARARASCGPRNGQVDLDDLRAAFRRAGRRVRVDHAGEQRDRRDPAVRDAAELCTRPAACLHCDASQTPAGSRLK